MIYYRNGVNDNEWTQVDPLGSRLKQVSVSRDGNHIWGVNSEDMIYYRNGVCDTNWTQVEPTESRLKQVSVSGDGNHVWGVNSEDMIYYRNGVHSDKKWTQVEPWKSFKTSKCKCRRDPSYVWGVNM